MEDTSKPIIEDNIDQESIQHWGNLRSILKDWKEKMKVSDEEIAVGLGIGRQAVNRFINGYIPQIVAYFSGENYEVDNAKYYPKEENYFAFAG